MVDAGDAFRRSPVLDPGDRDQREAKAALIAESLVLGGLDAALPARGEFAFGRAFVERTAAAAATPYVVSNLTCSEPLPWPTSLEFDRGGVHIVVYGIESSKLVIPGCTVTDPAAVLHDAPAGDAVVLVLSDLERGEDIELAKSAPAVDILVRGDSIEQLATPFRLYNGGVILSSGSRGKALGVFAATLQNGASSWRDAGAPGVRAAEVDAAAAKLTELHTRRDRAEDPEEQRRLDRQVEFWDKKATTAKTELAAATAGGGLANTFTNELRGLGPDVGEHAATLARVDAVKSTLPATTPPAHVAAGGTASTGGFGPFVGSAACAPCHAAEAAQWSTTAHARAWPSLVADKRQFDQDCFSCHVTGALDVLGPKDPHALGGLENVGCESCHGAGREHARDPKLAHLVADPPVSQCVRCHDSRQDNGRFDVATYLPRIRHGAKK